MISSKNGREWMVATLCLETAKGYFADKKHSTDGLGENVLEICKNWGNPKKLVIMVPEMGNKLDKVLMAESKIKNNLKQAEAKLDMEKLSENENFKNIQVNA